MPEVCRQLFLFCKPATPALSHRADPDTSRQAADKLQESGRLTGQRKAVLDGLRQHDGSTSAELAHAMGCDRYLTARRLPDLAREGHVRQGPARTCRVRGSECVTWWVTGGAC
jgi:hypothetical protein